MSTTVPDGHSVILIKGTLDPLVARARGGLLVASTGADGDEPLVTVRAVLEELKGKIDRSPVTLVGSVSAIADLFAPAVPHVQTVETMALLVFQPRSGLEWTEKAEHIESMLSLVREIAKRTRLIVYVPPDDAALSRLARLFRGLGIEVRHPSDDGAVAALVSRPDGMTITGLTGDAPLAATSMTESELRDAIAWAVKADAPVPEPPARAPHLRRLLLAVTKNDGEREALYRHFAARRRVLGLIAKPAPGGGAIIAESSWPGLEKAFVVHTDLAALHRAAKETGHEPGTYGVAGMSVETLFKWAASLGKPLAFCVYEMFPDGTGKPWYVPVKVPDIEGVLSASSS